MNFEIIACRPPVYAASIFFLTRLIDVYSFPYLYVLIIVTIIAIFFCLIYNFDESRAFTVYASSLLVFGLGLFASSSIFLFFFAYELLLLPSFLILYLFAKTRRCVEAAYLMFFWTQFGAIMLIASFVFLFLISGTVSFSSIALIEFSNFEVNLLFCCWILAFGVKLPIWPFYEWLPKAHVEASTNFSIFLSGVLVKFAFFGLFRCILCLNFEPSWEWIIPFLILGIIDVLFKLFYQIDLKKLVAYATVIEMHWLTLTIISGFTPLLLAGTSMLIGHAFISTNSFLLIDAVNRRFKTRLITEITALNLLCPNLFLFNLANLLLFLGFPGSVTFISEFLFFSFLFDFAPILGFSLLLILYLLSPSLFFRIWFNFLFGSSTRITKNIPCDLTKTEIGLFAFILFLLVWLGLTWTIFLY